MCLVWRLTVFNNTTQPQNARFIAMILMKLF